MKHNSIAWLNLSLALCLIAYSGKAQEEISWLNDFTSEVVAGSYTYKYSFYTLETDCKLKIEEKKTNNKGAETTQSSVFYLSDISPSSVSFKSSGKTLTVNMETKQSQKFISSYAGDEFQGYTNEINMYTSEVDKARSLIDAFLSHIETCKDNERKWSSTTEAFNWLTENIGKSEKSGTIYDQSFGKGEKEYIAKLEAKSTDSKGQQKVEVFSFDLSDIDPVAIELVVSGKSLRISLPIKNKNSYVQVITNDKEISYAKVLEIHVDDIEMARDQISALKHLISNTEVHRAEYSSYSNALSYVKDNITDVTVGSNKFAQSLSFEESPSGLVSYKSVKTDSKGISSEQLLEFYFSDISPDVNMNVSSSQVSIEILTSNKNKYIRQTIDGNLASYTNEVIIYTGNIDAARDLINAIKYAQKNSESGVKKFESLNDVTQWFNSNLEKVTIDANEIQQKIAVSAADENKIELNKITTPAEGNSVNEIIEIYPEDLVMKDVVITISGDELSITLSTGKTRYIKSFKDGLAENYTSETEVFFNDIKTAKSFIAAISYLHGNSKVENRSFSDANSAFTYISDKLLLLETDGTTYDQKIEQMDGNICKLKYTLKETNSKGTIGNVYEFMPQDIDVQSSNISIYGKELKVNLVTKGKEKLIKPYKDGVAGNFIYSFDLYIDDILIAKKMLAAFESLNGNCK